jgi:LmbE family N-acetylglucosaminyl deacetylase
MDCSPASPPHTGAAFLADLAAGGPIKQRVAMVVAHPDDEAIGAGGQLHRFENLTLIFGADGAPRDGRDMRRTGHASIEAYATTRRTELTAALKALQLSDHAVIRLDLPDGELIFAVEILVSILAEMFARNQTEVVMTHAYEGGHPDHDALALAVHLAARRCAIPPSIVEIPYYHAGPDGWVLQSFPESEPGQIVIPLSEDAWMRKCAMLDAHQSQAEQLSGFRQPIEKFRLARAHNFLRPPNEGRWLYEQVAPTLHPEAWLARARAVVVAEGGA